MSNPFISPLWLLEHLHSPDLRIVDGSWYLPQMNRDADQEFINHHIPGAVRFDLDKVKDQTSPWPHMLPLLQDFSRWASEAGISEHHHIVVYDGAGLLSAPRVRWTFQTFGAKHVSILEGGLPAWIKAGYPLETGAAQPRAASVFQGQFKPDNVASRDDVQRALTSRAAQIVDARPTERFAGHAPEPRPNLPSGHIKGSLNVPSSLLIENGKLKPVSQLESIFKDASVDLDQPIVTSCGSGVTASIVSLALEVLGKPAQSLYDGSWAEWAKTMPAEKF